MKPTILLLGNTGQLGWELERTLPTLGELIAFDYPQIDMSDPVSINNVVKEVKPDIIFNATAYTDVDQAETEPELAMAINGTGPGILAEQAQKIKAVLIHYSTDYVFDGNQEASYTETAAPNPINIYGETKLAGEKAVQDVGSAYLIFRTSWVFSSRRHCFVTKVLRWARENEVLRIVDDQISAPTWARTLAEASAQVLAQGRNAPLDYLHDKRGLYHLSGTGACSRFEWAQAILELDPGKDRHKIKSLLPAKSNEFPTSAIRPRNSALSCSKFTNTFSLYPPHWAKSLTTMMKEKKSFIY